MKKNLLIVFMTSLFALGLTACDDGPAENAGEKIDETTTDIGNSIEDACEDVKEGAGAENQNC